MSEYLTAADVTDLIRGHTAQAVALLESRLTIAGVVDLDDEDEDDAPEGDAYPLDDEPEPYHLTADERAWLDEDEGDAGAYDRWEDIGEELRGALR